MQFPIKDKHGHSYTWSQAFFDKFIPRLDSYLLDFTLMCLHLITYVPSHTIRNLVWRAVGIKLGKNSTLHTGVRVYDPRNIKVGEGTIIGYHCLLDGRGELKIGNHTDIASEVMIYNSQHDIRSPEFSPTTKPVTIGNYVFVGPRAIILPGVRIHNNAVVAAGAIVTKDVEEGMVVAGSPAKVIGERGLANPNYRLGRFKLFQ